MTWQNPKTDWVANPKNPMPEDFNRIEGNIDFLKQDIETKKGLIVTAINDMNQSAEVTDTHAQLADKIRDISNDATAAVGDVEKGKTFYAEGEKRTGTLELTGNAGTGDVLVGKTFYNTALKTKRTGSMPNNGDQSATLTITGSAKPTRNIPPGYTSGGTITAQLSSALAPNIKKGVSIGGVAGTYDKIYGSGDLIPIQAVNNCAILTTGSSGRGNFPDFCAWSKLNSRWCYRIDDDGTPLAKHEYNSDFTDNIKIWQTSLPSDRRLSSINRRRVVVDSADNIYYLSYHGSYIRLIKYNSSGGYEGMVSPIYPSGKPIDGHGTERGSIAITQNDVILVAYAYGPYDSYYGLTTIESMHIDGYNTSLSRIFSKETPALNVVFEFVAEDYSSYAYGKNGAYPSYYIRKIDSSGNIVAAYGNPVESFNIDKQTQEVYAIRTSDSMLLKLNPSMTSIIYSRPGNARNIGSILHDADMLLNTGGSSYTFSNGTLLVGLNSGLSKELPLRNKTNGTQEEWLYEDYLPLNKHDLTDRYVLRNKWGNVSTIERYINLT